MKKALIIIPNLVIIGLILYFIVGYANSMEEESKRSAIEAYEKSRGFYADIKSFPAPIAKNRNELEKVFRDKLYDNYSKEQLEDFFKEYMGSCDGHSAERILSELSIS